MTDIKKYESLCKMSFSNDDRVWASGCLESFVQGFSALDTIETGGIAPLISVLDVMNIYRDDAVVKNISRDAMLANAPEQYDGYFLVPKTV